MQAGGGQSVVAHGAAGAVGSVQLVRVLAAVVLGAWLLLPSAASAQPAPTVTMGDDSFSTTQVDISAGQTVVWTNANSKTHTVTAEGGSFDSGDLATGDQFSMEFDTPGTYAYYCQYHGDVGGVGMSGVIVVN